MTPELRAKMEAGLKKGWNPEGSGRFFVRNGGIGGGKKSESLHGQI